MKLPAILFPQQPRSFSGQRWLNISLRTMHLIGVAGTGAAFLFNLSERLWLPYMLLTIISGCLMILLETWSDGVWLIQLRGLATALKLLILSMTFFVGLQAWILFCVIAIAGLISHAPGKVRYYCFNFRL